MPGGEVNQKKTRWEGKSTETGTRSYLCFDPGKEGVKPRCGEKNGKKSRKVPVVRHTEGIFNRGGREK